VASLRHEMELAGINVRAVNDAVDELRENLREVVNDLEGETASAIEGLRAEVDDRLRTIDGVSLARSATASELKATLATIDRFITDVDSKRPAAVKGEIRLGQDKHLNYLKSALEGRAR
jgi:hypothetical protein